MHNIKMQSRATPSLDREEIRRIGSVGRIGWKVIALRFQVTGFTCLKRLWFQVWASATRLLINGPVYRR